MVDYKEKYLKYKSKYLELKAQLGGVCQNLGGCTCLVFVEDKTKPTYYIKERFIKKKNQTVYKQSTKEEYENFKDEKYIQYKECAKCHHTEEHESGY